MFDEKNCLMTGWAQVNITPKENVYLAGQHYARISEGIMDPITSTALAFESVKEGQSSGSAIMVSCDLVGISDELLDEVREKVKSKMPEIKSQSIFLNATHTHAAPLARVKKRYQPDSEQNDDDSAPYGIELDAMAPRQYVDFAAERIADAVGKAWKNRNPSGIAYGLGHAVVAHNRRLTYKDGSSKMYGNPRTPDFSHVEGYEDHAISIMSTYNEKRKMTGLMVNVPCPSQVSEHAFEISADYWHETREELRRRFGKEIFIFPQCAPAGDQSPRVLVGKRAEERMWRLKGINLEQNQPRQEIARRIADAVSDIIPYVEQEIDWKPVFSHSMEILNMPRRILTAKDVEEVTKDMDEYRKEYESQLEKIKNNPEIRRQNRWYSEVTRPFMKLKWLENVEKRLTMQKEQPHIPMELHALRIGDIALATNPFELYLDYAIRIRELSNAAQTFLVQLTGAGSYLPSQRSVACKGYGSVPASTDIGPEGGEKLVDWTVNTINDMGF